MSWCEGPVLFVAGLRGDVADHWQSRLARQLPYPVVVDSFGRDKSDLDGRVTDLQAAVAGLDEPATIVAHSAGVLVTLHWAQRFGGAGVRAALLATPPDLDRPLPEEYPSLGQLADAGWLPVPQDRLPFPSLVAASSNDELGDPARIRALASHWGSVVEDLGPVGHMNPVAGFGTWAAAFDVLDRLEALAALR